MRRSCTNTFVSQQGGNPITITSINPATKEELGTFATLLKVEVVEAIGKAHEAYRSWRQTSFDERKAVLLKFAEALRNDADEFARLITLEMGKRIPESQ